MNWKDAYQQVKKVHKDKIVLIRLGDFTEAFNDDARTVSEVCDVVLASRRTGDDRWQMAGVPSFCADKYIKQLIKAGHKVALLEPQSGYWVPEQARERE